MNRYTVAVLVSNKFGVLNRVTSMFRRRRFNINALTVSETESAQYSVRDKTILFVNGNVGFSLTFIGFLIASRTVPYKNPCIFGRKL